MAGNEIIADAADKDVGPAVSVKCIVTAVRGIVEVGGNPLHRIVSAAFDVTVITDEKVHPVFTGLLIVPGTADDDVVAGVAVEGIVAADAGIGGEDVVGLARSVIADHHAVVAQDNVGILVARNSIITETGDDNIEAGVSGNGIVSAGGGISA